MQILKMAKIDWSVCNENSVAPEGGSSRSARGKFTMNCVRPNKDKRKLGVKSGSYCFILMAVTWLCTSGKDSFHLCSAAASALSPPPTPCLLPLPSRLSEVSPVFLQSPVGWSPRSAWQMPSQYVQAFVCTSPGPVLLWPTISSRWLFGL